MLNPHTITCDLLELVPNAQAAWLYGSVAKGEAGNNSDVDVAVLFDAAHTVDSWALSQSASLLADSAKGLFLMLAQRGVIAAPLSQSLLHMVGFRNLAVHDYVVLNVTIVERMITTQLGNVLLFSQTVLKQFFNQTAH